MTVHVKGAAGRRRAFGQVLADWPIWLHQVGLGRLLGRGYAIICTTGRRTGAPRRAGVVVLREEQATRTVFVLAGTQAAHWYRNLSAGSNCQIWIGGDRFTAAHRTLSRAETLEVLTWHRTRRRFQARMQAMFFGWKWSTDQAGLSNWAEGVVGVAFRPLAKS